MWAALCEGVVLDLDLKHHVLRDAVSRGGDDVSRFVATCATPAGGAAHFASSPLPSAEVACYGFRFVTLNCWAGIFLPAHCHAFLLAPSSATAGQAYGREVEGRFQAME